MLYIARWTVWCLFVGDKAVCNAYWWFVVTGTSYSTRRVSRCFAYLLTDLAITDSHSGLWSQTFYTINCTGDWTTFPMEACKKFSAVSTHTHPFNSPSSGTTRLSRYQGKTSLDFTEVRNSEWQWHQLGHLQVCASLQTDNHASTSPLKFLQAGCPSCRPTNSVKALKAS